MLSPTRSGPKVSGDFEALLNKTDSDGRPQPVQLKGLNLRRSSSPKKQTSSSTKPDSDTGTGASPGTAYDSGNGSPAQISRPETGDSAVGSREKHDQETNGVPVEAPYLQNLPRSGSEDSFATAAETMSVRSLASTLWEEPQEVKHLISPFEPAGHSQLGEHASAGARLHDQGPAFSGQAATELLEPSGASSGPSSVGAFSHDRSDGAGPASQQDAPLAASHQQMGAAPSAPHPNASHPDSPQSAGAVLVPTSHGLQAGDDAKREPHLADAQEAGLPLPASATISDSDEPQGPDRQQHAAPLQAQPLGDYPATDPVDPELQPMSQVQSPGQAHSTGSRAPTSRSASSGPSSPSTPCEAAAGPARAYLPHTQQSKTSAAPPMPHSVPALHRHEPGDAATLPGQGQAGISSLGEQQLQPRLRSQHSRSSSEVVGPGEDDFSLVDASELESYAGSEGGHPEADSGARERSAQVGALGRAAGLAAAEVGSNEESEVWRRQRRHLFVLSNAGKPVYSLHGDENALAGLMATLQALISFVKDQGDSLQSVKAGRHVVVFLEKGPLYFVAVAATGEPVSTLQMQLSLLHAQIVCILTDGFERMLARNPRYDSRRLLGGAEGVLEALVQSFDTDPAAALTAFAPLKMPALLRRSLLVALQAAVKEGGAQYGVLLAGTKVAAVAQPRSRLMHPHDLLALSAFVRGTPSLQAAETFSPVCLPHFNAAAFLHAYVHYVRQDSGVCLILLSAQPDSFMRLADAARRFRSEINDSGALQAAARSAAQQGDGQVSIAGLPSVAGGGEPGMTPLVHFLYKHPGRCQYVMASWDSLGARGRLPQDVMPLYCRIHAAVFRADEDLGSPTAAPLRVYYHSTDEFSALAYASAEYELYALFDPVSQKEVVVRICQRLCAWVKAQQSELFVPV